MVAAVPGARADARSRSPLAPAGRGPGGSRRRQPDRGGGATPKAASVAPTWLALLDSRAPPENTLARRGDPGHETISPLRGIAGRGAARRARRCIRAGRVGPRGGRGRAARAGAVP